MLWCITEMCHGRILSRLRSQHAKKTQKTRGKKSLPDLLMDALHTRPHKGVNETIRMVVVKIQSQCRDFLEIFKLVENCQNKDRRVEILLQLLSIAYKFDDLELSCALSTCERLDPSLLRYLPTAIGKLKHYTQVAINLTNAANSSKYTVFQDITVTAVSYQKVSRKSLGSQRHDFESVLERLPNHNLTKQMSSHRAELRERYEKKVESREQWNVHAEIQLLLSYETDTTNPRPRVIYSSKSACYLCRLFFDLHGGSLTPISHGRLYDKWLLPDWSSEHARCLESISSTMERMINALAESIVRNLGKDTLSQCQPNESVVGIYHHWTSASTLMPTESGPYANVSSTLKKRFIPVPKLPHLESSGSSTPDAVATTELRYDTPSAYFSH